MIHVKPFIYQLIPIFISYSIIILFISFIRRHTPHIALEDRILDMRKEKELFNLGKIRYEMINPYKLNRSSELDIRIVSAKRLKPYIHATLGSLCDVYKTELPPVTICNVENTVNEEANELKQSNWTVININDGFTANMSTLSLRIEKETRDYWKCLNVSKSREESRYTLLLEDDVFVHSQFKSMINSLIYQLDYRLDIDYVKLYHINRLRHISSLPQIISFCILTSWCLHCFFSPRLIVSIIGFLILFCYLHIVQRNLFPPDLRYSITNSVYITMSESCCTPAVLFRSSSIPSIVQTLSKEKSYAGHAKDHILDESIFVGRQTDFNLVSHIGLISSLRRNQP